EQPLARGPVRLRPALLRHVRPLQRKLDVGAGAARHSGQQATGGRVLDFELVVLVEGGGHPRGELTQPRGVDALRSGRRRDPPLRGQAHAGLTPNRAWKKSSIGGSGARGSSAGCSSWSE